MKVILINNYPMDEKWQLWKDKKTGGHHLWGATNLKQYGLEIKIPAHEKYKILKKISEKIKILGDLDQQFRILLQQKEFDIVYTGHYRNTLLLAFLRQIGLFNKPIFAVACQSLPTNPLTSLFFNYFVKGHDKLICMNPRIKKQFKDDFKIPQAKLDFLEWGIDLSYCDFNLAKKNQKFPLTDSPFILSAGKTYRDYNTLTQAFNKTDYPLRIYCTKNSAPKEQYISQNIRVEYSRDKQEVLTDEEIYKEHKRAYAIAIPLDVTEHNSHNMIGITSLLDAMAMGKASIMTRNPQINIDIEREGIGIWVEPGDVEGWRKAITYLIEHPAETKAMGQKGRYLCETKYNLDIFSQQLNHIFQKSLAR